MPGAGSVPEVADPGEHHRDPGARRRRRSPRRRGASRRAGSPRWRRPGSPPRARRRTGRRRPTRRPSRGVGGSASPALAAASAAFWAAMRTLSTRLIWPAPMPTVAPPRAKTIAFDLTCLATVSANSRSAISASVGARLVTTLSIVAGGRRPGRAPGSAARRPVRASSSSRLSGRAARPATSSRSAALRARISRAAGSASGAMMTSTKIFAIASAVAASSGRFSATMPPKALTGSQASALSQASRRLRADRGAARVGVLDDRDRRLGELGDQLVGGVGVGVVVVGQLLALDLARGRDAGAGLAGAVEARRAGAGSRRSGCCSTSEAAPTSVSGKVTPSSRANHSEIAAS